jgi:hypothetical protein
MAQDTIFIATYYYYYFLSFWFLSNSFIDTLEIVQNAKKISMQEPEAPGYTYLAPTKTT